MNQQSKKKTAGKKLPLFYLIYIVVIVVALLLLAFGAALLHNILGEYEEVQPKHLAERIFHEQFEDFSYRTMREHYDMPTFLNESGYDTEEAFWKATEELLGAEQPVLYRSSSGISDKVEYSVAINKVRVASFTLIPSGEKTPHGFEHYELGEIKVYNPIRMELVSSDETQPPPTYLFTYVITAPLTHKVTVDGKELGEEDRKGDIVYDTTCLASHQSGFIGVPFVSYEVVLETVPEVKATDLNGDTVTPEYDEEGRSFRFALTFDRAMTDQVKDYVIGIAEKLGVYMQAGARFSSISGYYDESSELYKQLRQIEDAHWMVVPYETCSFSQQSVSEFYRYSEDAFSVRVSVLQRVTHAGKPDMTDLLDYTFCFHRVGEDWLLFESYNN